jgi:hypothetical protein
MLYSALHYDKLNCAALHYDKLNCAVLDYFALRSSTLHCFVYCAAMIKDHQQCNIFVSLFERTQLLAPAFVR